MPTRCHYSIIVDRVQTINMTNIHTSLPNVAPSFVLHLSWNSVDTNIQWKHPMDCILYGERIFILCLPFSLIDYHSNAIVR